MHDPTLACVSRGCSGGVSFATCSADGTIRLWDLALQPDMVDNDGGNHLLNIESPLTARLVSAGTFERDTMEASIRTHGFRSIAASSDGKYLAAGDCEGNLHLYDLHTSDYTCFQGVHEAEILSLSFSLSSNKYHISEEVVDDNYFLASGGRDRIIHLYDVRRNFDLVQSIDDHSAAVTSVKLTCNEILSCSADRSLVFRDVSATDGGHKILRRQQIASHGTVYDMAVSPTMDFVVTVGQDKKINTFSITSGKLMRSFKQDKDFGEPIKVTMDPSCSYLVCSYSNKSLCMYDSISGEMVMQVMGHGEVVTGVIFLPDCKHIVSVGGDGCIFVWKLPASISSTILHRMKENSGPSGLLTSENLVLPVAFSRIKFSEEEDQHIRSQDKLSNQFVQKVFDQGGASQRTPRFRFSISRLPMWARSKVAHSNIKLQQNSEEQILSPVISNGGGYSPFCHEAQTPPGLDERSNASCLRSLSRNFPENNNIQTSPMSQETLKDKNWLNIYTVCLDLFDSPEAKFSMDLKRPVLSSNLLQNPTKIPSNVECSPGKAHLVMEDDHRAPSRRLASSSNHGFIDNSDDHFSKHNSSICRKAVSGHIVKQLGLYKSGSQMQKAMEVDDSLMKYEDLFTQHFGSLSTSSKVERIKSSVRRRYSARFTVRRDYPGDCKKLFDTAAWEVTTVPTASGNPEIQNLEEDHEDNSCKQNSGPAHTLPQGKSGINVLEEHFLSTSLKEAMEQKDKIPEGNNLQERTTACREALLQLNAAAQNVFNLFTEFGTLVSKEEISNGSGAKLYDEADKLLPSIAERLNAVAELVQRRNNSSCRSNMVQVPGFEPLLETFAENLSQRVMEMVKKNLNKD